MIAAHQAGMSLTEIGRVAGISRQRVKQLIERGG
jgi:DNA-directed RNA polymerase specialized sigma subunit